LSIEITIKQKGLLKKELPLEVILGKELRYGAFDGLRLEEDQMADGEFVAYHPNHIARGFSVQWKKGEKNQVYMRLPSPTCEEELDDFYDATERIANFWRAGTIEQDGNSITVKEMNASRRMMKDSNLRILKDFVSHPEKGSLTLFCAFWPIVLGDAEYMHLAALPDLSGFRDFLHRKQAIDVYYAKPMFYRNKEGNFGLYAFTEDTRSIFPLIPYVPFGTKDPESGTQLEVDRWYVSLVSITYKKSMGIIKYLDFISAIKQEQREYYDAENIIIEGMNLEQMTELVENYRTEI
jgi:hypothetical protein